MKQFEGETEICLLSRALAKPYTFKLCGGLQVRSNVGYRVLNQAMPCASKTTRISLATDQTLPSGLRPSCRERYWHSFLRKAESAWPKSSAFSCYTQEWKTYVQDE